MPESIIQPRPPNRPGRKPRSSARSAATSKSVFDPYELRDPPAILSYVVEHPELETFLADAPARIRQVFGPDIPLALEIAYDYEGPPGNRELWVMVSCPPDVDFAIDRLHTLDREWLVHLPRSLRGIANIDTEFR